MYNKTTKQSINNGRHSSTYYKNQDKSLKLSSNIYLAFMNARQDMIIPPSWSLFN